jgi:tight adherence protein C
MTVPAVLAALVALASGMVALAVAEGASIILDFLIARLRREAERATIHEVFTVVVVPQWVEPALIRMADEVAVSIAGIGIPSHTFVRIQWASSLAGLACAMLTTLLMSISPLSIALSTGIVLAGIAAPRSIAKTRWRQRRRVLERSLPDYLDRLSLAIETGLGFEPAMRRAAEGFPGPIGGIMRSVVSQGSMGHSRDNVMKWLAANHPCESLQSFSTAVRNASRLGAPLGPTLRLQVEWMRATRRRRAQAASRRLPVLVAFPLVLFFLPALLIVYLAPPLLHLFLGT